MAKSDLVKGGDPVGGAQRGLLKPGLPQVPKVPFGLGQYGSRKEPDPRYLFGTDQEVMNRNATGYTLSGTPPENSAPSFKQIAAGPTSKDLNAPGPTSRQGNSKFGSPRKYA